MLFLLLINAFSLDPIRPIHDMLRGEWNVSKIEITKDGYENPDVKNFSFVLKDPIDNITYMTKITPYDLTSNAEFDPIELVLTVNPESENFKLSLNNLISVENNITTSVDLIRRAVGAVNSPYDFSYSFVLLSSYRAELSIFNRTDPTVCIYRFWKKFDVESTSSFGRYASYLLRRALFRLI